jgi:hypothetical protein
MTMIGQHRESLGEEVEKIDGLRKEFERLLEVYEVPNRYAEILMAI